MRGGMRGWCSACARRRRRWRRATANSPRPLRAITYKLYTYKDEWSRVLYTRTDFLKRLDGMFEGDYKVMLNMAPPLWAKRDKLPEMRASANTGRARFRC